MSTPLFWPHCSQISKKCPSIVSTLIHLPVIFNGCISIQSVSSCVTRIYNTQPKGCEQNTMLFWSHLAHFIQWDNVMLPLSTQYNIMLALLSSTQDTLEHFMLPKIVGWSQCSHLNPVVTGTQLSQAGVQYRFFIFQDCRHGLSVYMEVCIARPMTKKGKVMNHRSPKKSFPSLLFDSLL